MVQLNLFNITPLFLVTDVVKAAEHYRDKLGFRILDYYGDPPCFVFVTRGGVDIMLKLAEPPAQANPNGAYGVWDGYVWVSDIEAIHAELRGRGAKIVKEPTSAPYGAREMEVEDSSGYRICFAENVAKSE